MISPTPSNKPTPPLKAVWDVPTRLFHWALVLLVTFSWFSNEMGWIEYHMRSGMAILTLVLFRLMWGVIGSPTARFWNFLAGPGTTIRYLKGLRSGDEAKWFGHNPAGGWSIMALLGLLGLQGSLGLFANDDIFTRGPLFHLVSKRTSDMLTGYHGRVFNVLVAVIALHVTAALFYRFIKRDDLITPMITGKKAWEGDTPQALSAGSQLWRGLLALGLAALAVWYIVTQI